MEPYLCCLFFIWILPLSSDFIVCNIFKSFLLKLWFAFISKGCHNIIHHLVIETCNDLDILF